MPRNSHWRVPSTWRSERYEEDLQLSPQMRAVLKAAAEPGRAVAASTEILRALSERALCDTDGRLSDYGKVIAVSLVPLQQQCSILELPLDECVHTWDGRPEPAALQLHLSEDAWGYTGEGAVLHSLIHALVLPRLYATMAKAWNAKAGYDRARSWLYRYYAGYNDILDVVPDMATHMLADVRAFDRSAFVESWRTLREWNVANGALPHPAKFIGTDEALATLDAVGAKRLGDIAERIFADPYAYYHGWPDLMVLGLGGRLTFYEVKTTDRLRYGQIVTMTDMRSAADLDIRVMRLSRAKQ